jgi:L-tyrosine reductase
MVERHLDGRIPYISQKGYQIKVGGFRIKLEAVESTLLNTGKYSEVVAVKN